MDTQTPKTTQSVKFKPLILALAAFVALLIAFQIGMFVGFHKASYSNRWGDNYHRMFAGPRRGFFDDFQGHGFMDAHGMFGTVLKIDGNNLIIKDKDETEKTIIVSTSTAIRTQNNTVKLSDIPTGGNVVVIGAPNAQGQIDAKFIRVFAKP